MHVHEKFYFTIEITISVDVSVFCTFSIPIKYVFCSYILVLSFSIFFNPFALPAACTEITFFSPQAIVRKECNLASYLLAMCSVEPFRIQNFLMSCHNLHPKRVKVWSAHHKARLARMAWLHC